MGVWSGSVKGKLADIENVWNGEIDVGVEVADEFDRVLRKNGDEC